MSEERRDYERERINSENLNCTVTEERECNCHETKNNTSCGCQTKPTERLNRKNTDRVEKIRKITEQAEREREEKIILGKDELQEVYRNATVGMESVEILRPLCADRGFRNILLKQYKSYSSVAKEVELYAEEYDIELDSPSIFAKGMMFFTTMVNTLKDKSNSKLAEIMIQGINMGIISLTKVINRSADEGRNNIYAEEMLKILQNNLEEMKLFL